MVWGTSNPIHKLPKWMGHTYNNAMVRFHGLMICVHHSWWRKCGGFGPKPLHCMLSGTPPHRTSWQELQSAKSTFETRMKAFESQTLQAANAQVELEQQIQALQTNKADMLTKLQSANGKLESIQAKYSECMILRLMQKKSKWIIARLINLKFLLEHLMVKN